jgi:hypothetical protein
MGEHVVCMGVHNSHRRACNTQGKASHIHGRANSTHDGEGGDLYEHMIPMPENVMSKGKHAIYMGQHIVPLEERHLYKTSEKRLLGKHIWMGCHSKWMLKKG